MASIAATHSAPPGNASNGVCTVALVQGVEDDGQPVAGPGDDLFAVQVVVGVKDRAELEQRSTGRPAAAGFGTPAAKTPSPTRSATAVPFGPSAPISTSTSTG